MDVIFNPAPHLCQVAEFIDRFEYEYADDKRLWLTYLSELQSFLTMEIMPLNLQRLPSLKLVDVRKWNQKTGIAPPTCGKFSAPTAIELGYSLWGKIPTLLFCVNREIQAAYRREDFEYDEPACPNRRFPFADAAEIVKLALEIFDVVYCRQLHSLIERELVFVNVHDLSNDEQAVFDNIDSKPRFNSELEQQSGVSARKIGGKDGIVSKLKARGLVHHPDGPRKGVVRKEF